MTSNRFLGAGLWASTEEPRAAPSRTAAVIRTSLVTRGVAIASRSVVDVGGATGLTYKLHMRTLGGLAVLALTAALYQAPPLSIPAPRDSPARSVSGTSSLVGHVVIMINGQRVPLRR